MAVTQTCGSFSDSLNVCFWVPGHAVTAILHAGDHAVHHDGYQGHEQAHGGERHERDEVLPVRLQVLARWDEAVQ